MSGRVLRFEGSAHTEAQRLLPWFVNGTLKDEELALIERHLAKPECQAGPRIAAAACPRSSHPCAPSSTHRPAAAADRGSRSGALRA